MEYITGPNAFRHFQVISNELVAPRFLICPAEFDRARSWSTNFSMMSNSNLSYFAGLDADGLRSRSIVWGDRNLTNGTPEINGVLGLSTNRPTGWTEEMHHEVGNIVLADGSAWQVTDTALRAAVANTGLATNRLQMPVLAP
jgi:hypothetical protein